MSLDTDNAEFKSRARFVIFFATGLFLILFVAWIARIILLLLFAAILCAVLLSTVTDWAHAKLRLSRGLALILVIASAGAFIGLGIWFRGSEIVEQVSRLHTDLPVAAHKLLAQLQTTDWGRWILARFSDSAQQSGGVTFAIARIGGIVLGSATVITGLVIVGIASLYFAAEPQSYLRVLRLITPLRYQGTMERCLTGAARQLRWWLVAKLLSMIAVGLLISAGLWILRIPLAGTLGIIAACLTFIPNAGPILSAVPAGLLAFAISPTKGCLTILLFFLVHFIEGNFVTPLAERQIVKLPPGLTLFVQLLLAALAGAVGIALAAPLTAAVSGAVLALTAEEKTDNVEKLSRFPFPSEPVRHGH